jgi:Fe/S biogenesis protein NfuA
MATDTAATDTAATEAAATDPRIVEVSEPALEKVIEIRDEEDDAENLCLRIEIVGVEGADYTYDLAFETLDEVHDGDAVTRIGDLTLVVPADSVDKLRGAVLDVPTSPLQSGLVLRNPNRPDALAGAGDADDLELTGDLSEKVTQLLEARVNPALSAHGGFATLVRVDDDNNVYVNMGGGCQGCAMSQATLVEGIQRAIKEAIPEVVEVVDATDHDAGENPYF